MVTYWECFRCGKIFKINNTVKKRLDIEHRKPFCSCGCGVTEQKTEFHYDNYQEKLALKERKKSYAVKSMINDPKWKWLEKPHNEIMKRKEDE